MRWLLFLDLRLVDQFWLDCDLLSLHKVSIWLTLWEKPTSQWCNKLFAGSERCLIWTHLCLLSHLFMANLRLSWHIYDWSILLDKSEEPRSNNFLLGYLEVRLLSYQRRCCLLNHNILDCRLSVPSQILEDLSIPSSVKLRDHWTAAASHEYQRPHLLSLCLNNILRDHFLILSMHWGLHLQRTESI